MLKVVSEQIGYTEGPGGYSKFGDWYSVNIDKDPVFKNAAWCDMFLTWAGHKVGAQEYVGEFAYTPYHAAWFKEQGAWTDKPEPGAIVFFDWGGSKEIDNIDHVGIVEKPGENGKVHTIEGNSDGIFVKRQVRDEGDIVGYGLPAKVKERKDAEAAKAQALTPTEAPTPAPAEDAAQAPAQAPAAAEQSLATLFGLTPAGNQAAARKAEADAGKTAATTPDARPQSARKAESSDTAAVPVSGGGNGGNGADGGSLPAQQVSLNGGTTALAAHAMPSLPPAGDAVQYSAVPAGVLTALLATAVIAAQVRTRKLSLAALKPAALVQRVRGSRQGRHHSVDE
ncbi:CHAP domain-containing protein [Bailinhaonella thermotolerans]|nr:CHAP domain-containing protein [Bailinhaonella thermotolerans]